MAHPQLNSSQQAVIEQRRTFVARLRLRGLSQREIVTALGKQGIINPDTGEAWSVATVNRDLQAALEEWQKQYASTFDEHVASLLAEYREVRREAWRQNDLDMVLRSCMLEARLLGLDKPDRLIVDWRREAQEAGIDAGDLFERIVQEFAAIQKST